MRRVDSRIKDFNEIWDYYDKTNINPILDKCLNCSDSFCSNSNDCFNVGCPIKVNIPKIISLMKYKLYDEAYKELISVTPFPEILSRVCNGYCEISCINAKDGEATKIRDIIRFLSDYAFKNNLVKYDNLPPNGKKVSIIGSGASGLACADYLIKNGYSVTVYEKDDYPGGTLMYGTPNMRLDKSILELRIDALKEAGVKFLCNTEVTRVISPSDVLAFSDAVVLSCGRKEKIYSVSGRGLKNIVLGVDYLKQSTKNIVLNGYSNILEKKNVLIIGAGKTASDCLSIALREHASMVAIIDYKDMPKLKRSNSWPYEDDSLPIDYSIEEARFITKMEPRSYNSAVKEIKGEMVVQGVTVINVKWIDGTPYFDEKGMTFPIDTIIIAVGQASAEEDLLEYFNIDLINDNYNSKNHKNDKKVFICGEAILNNGITALAIEDGINCAKEVMEYLEA